MKVIIVGCGRLGAVVAELLDGAGHSVIIVDGSTTAFRRLSPKFHGRAVTGRAIDEETLRRAGIGDADAFLALTDGDNTNLMASQMAKHIYHVPHVISQIKDPLRGDIFQTLGIATICPTIVGSEAFRQAIGL